MTILHQTEKVTIDSISIMTRSSSITTTGISNTGYGKMENESEDGSLSDQFEEMPKLPRMRPKVSYARSKSDLKTSHIQFNLLVLLDLESAVF